MTRWWRLILRGELFFRGGRPHGPPDHQNPGPPPPAPPGQREAALAIPKHYKTLANHCKSLLIKSFEKHLKKSSDLQLRGACPPRACDAQPPPQVAKATKPTRAYTRKLAYSLQLPHA